MGGDRCPEWPRPRNLLGPRRASVQLARDRVALTRAGRQVAAQGRESALGSPGVIHILGQLGRPRRCPPGPDGPPRDPGAIHIF